MGLYCLRPVFFLHESLAWFVSTQIFGMVAGRCQMLYKLTQLCKRV